MALSILQLATVLLTGLSAGLFFAWTFTVMPGLARVSDEAFIRTMQSVNRRIQNPPFFLIFFGPAVLLPLSAFLLPGHGKAWEMGLLSLAAVFYIGGVFGVTALSNIPMNNRLDRIPVETCSAEELKAGRTAFERPWNRSNNVRTAAAIISFGLAVYALYGLPA